jgi:hypothetical protein
MVLMRPGQEPQDEVIRPICHRIPPAEQCPVGPCIETISRVHYHAGITDRMPGHSSQMSVMASFHFWSWSTCDARK